VYCYHMSFVFVSIRLCVKQFRKMHVPEIDVYESYYIGVRAC
jgi:hypothetical protein